MSHRCGGGCENTWTGSLQCHCSVCHRTFSILAHFDSHRKSGTCLDPVAMGLTPTDTGIWRAPGEHYNFEKETGE